MSSDPKAVLVETEIEDLFTTEGVLTRARGLALETQSYVRRPLRGIRLKRESFATLSVLGQYGYGVLTLRPDRVEWQYHTYGWQARRPPDQ